VRSVIRGVGSALPKRVMTNDDMSKVVDTTHEWIVERTGIKPATSPVTARRRARWLDGGGTRCAGRMPEWMRRTLT
jgi:hypothetical protein